MFKTKSRRCLFFIESKTQRRCKNRVSSSDKVYCHRHFPVIPAEKPSSVLPVDSPVTMAEGHDSENPPVWKKVRNLGKTGKDGVVTEVMLVSGKTRAYEVSGLHLKFRAWDFCFKWDCSDLLWSTPVDIRSVVLLARSEVPWGLQNLRCRG
jgi:hypothetical protein